MKELMGKFKKAMVEVSVKHPEEMKKFGEFMNTVLADGKLNVKTKELICVGIAMVSKCSYCIGIHVEKAFKAGATEDEIMETGMVAVLMGGGSAYTYLTELVGAIKMVKGSA